MASNGRRCGRRPRAPDGPRRAEITMSRLTLLIALSMFASASILADPFPAPNRPASARPVAVAARVTLAQAATLSDIQAETQRRVAEISRGLAGVPDGAERRARLRRVVEVKRQGHIALLTAQLHFARERGETARVSEVETALAQITTPRPL